GKCCGACQGGGVVACQGGAKVCVANPGNGGATLETCNGKDDNCDGLIDEVYDFQNDPLHCGNCMTSCMETNGVPGCKLGKCTDPAGVEVDANGVILPSELVCDGIDGNCNGVADETWPNKNTPCGTGTGLCATTATFVCNPAKTSTFCSADGTTPLAANPMA